MICMLHRLVHLVEMRWFGSLPPTKGFKSRVITQLSILEQLILLIFLGSVSGEVYPHLVPIFVWAAKLGKFLVANNLCKKGIVITDWCCTCKLSGETSSNLLSHCSIAYDLWVFFFLLCHQDCLGHAKFSQVYDGVLKWNDGVS